MTYKNSHIDLKTDFEAMYLSKVQELTQLRRSQMTQQKISDLTRVSLKTIQRFENYKFKSFYLMYAYKRLLK